MSRQRRIPDARARAALARMAPALSAALLLAACTGGEGGAPSAPAPAPGETAAGPGAAPVGPSFPQAAIMHLPDGRWALGRLPTDIANGRASPLAPAGEWRRASLTAGGLADGAAAEEVAAYLREEAADFFEGGVTAFPGNPVVGVSREASERQQRLVRRTVAVLNSALPYDRRLLIGEALAPLKRLDAVPDGQIYVAFGPLDRFEDAPPHTATEAIGAGGADIYSDGTIRAGFAIVDDTYDGPVSHTFILLHELAHALGFGHVSAATYPESILNPEATGDDRHHDDYAIIDRAALLAATRLSPGASPGEITADSLGPWDETSFHLRAEMALPSGALAFGVRAYNGFGASWAAGESPATLLADNPALAGSATWNGALLGLTDRQRVVAGVARISVNLAALDGRADFTQLESWTARMPGRPGSGTRWASGDLGYTIAIDGNSFFQTGGDDGTLSGIFVGAQHDGAAGTLERRDLSAAFGAMR